MPYKIYSISPLDPYAFFPSHELATAAGRYRGFYPGRPAGGDHWPVVPPGHAAHPDGYPPGFSARDAQQFAAHMYPPVRRSHRHHAVFGGLPQPAQSAYRQFPSVHKGIFAAHRPHLVRDTKGIRIILNTMYQRDPDVYRERFAPGHAAGRP